MDMAKTIKCPDCGGCQFVTVGTITLTGKLTKAGTLTFIINDKPEIENDIDCVSCGKSFSVDDFAKIVIKSKT